MMSQTGPLCYSSPTDVHLASMLYLTTPMILGAVSSIIAQTFMRFHVSRVIQLAMNSSSFLPIILEMTVTSNGTTRLKLPNECMHKAHEKSCFLCKYIIIYVILVFVVTSYMTPGICLYQFLTVHNVNSTGNMFSGHQGFLGDGCSH